MQTQDQEENLTNHGVIICPKEEEEEEKEEAEEVIFSADPRTFHGVWSDHVSFILLYIEED